MRQPRRLFGRGGTSCVEIGRTIGVCHEHPARSGRLVGRPQCGGRDEDLSVTNQVVGDTCATRMGCHQGRRDSLRPRREQARSATSMGGQRSTAQPWSTEQADERATYPASESIAAVSARTILLPLLAKPRTAIASRTTSSVVRSFPSELTHRTTSLSSPAE